MTGSAAFAHIDWIYRHCPSASLHARAAPRRNHHRMILPASFSAPARDQPAHRDHWRHRWDHRAAGSGQNRYVPRRRIGPLPNTLRVLTTRWSSSQETFLKWDHGLSLLHTVWNLRIYWVALLHRTPAAWASAFRVCVASRQDPYLTVTLAIYLICLPTLPPRTGRLPPLRLLPHSFRSSMHQWGVSSGYYTFSFMLSARIIGAPYATLSDSLFGTSSLLAVYCLTISQEVRTLTFKRRAALLSLTSPQIQFVRSNTGITLVPPNRRSCLPAPGGLFLGVERLPDIYCDDP